MRGTLRILLAALAAVMALEPACAQMKHRGMPDPRNDFERSALPSRAEPQRDLPSRGEFLPPGRMTAEERRQLRRDIHEAGRELYRRERPPHPSGTSD